MAPGIPNHEEQRVEASRMTAQRVVQKLCHATLQDGPLHATTLGIKGLERANTKVVQDGFCTLQPLRTNACSVQDVAPKGDLRVAHEAPHGQEIEEGRNRQPATAWKGIRRQVESCRPETQTRLHGQLTTWADNQPPTTTWVGTNRWVPDSHARPTFSTRLLRFRPCMVPRSLHGSSVTGWNQ